MLQARGELDLVQEAAGAEQRADLRPQQLDRDLTVVLAVAREIHGCHTPVADLPLDDVAVAQQTLQLRDRIAHTCSG